MLVPQIATRVIFTMKQTLRSLLNPLKKTLSVDGNNYKTVTRLIMRAQKFKHFIEEKRRYLFDAIPFFYILTCADKLYFSIKSRKKHTEK